VGKSTSSTLNGEISRARLHTRLDEAAIAGRLTVLVAGAGYGKTSLLRSWSRSRPTAWVGLGPDDRRPGTLAKHLVDALRVPTPDLSADMLLAASRMRGYEVDENAGVSAIAAGMAEALDHALRRRTVLILDDVDELAEAPESATLVDALVRHAPAYLHVVVAGRDQPPFRTARLIAHGEATELGAADLAFTPAETAELISQTADGDGESLAADVHHLTGGWPVAVRLAAEALAAVPPGERAAIVDALREPHGVLLRYVADEVIGSEPEQVLELLDCAQVLDGIESALAAAVGVPNADETFAKLLSRGVYLEPLPGFVPGRMMLRPLFRSYLARYRRLDPERVRTIRTAAARWHETAGEFAQALSYAVQLGDTEWCTRLLTEHGAALVENGAGSIVLAAAELLPESRSPAIEVLIGDAGLMQGRWETALSHYRRAAGDGTLPASVAWRIGLLHYLRGELTDAIKAYERGDTQDDALADRALLLAWSASAHWLRGDVEQCRDLAKRALVAARRAGDDRALAGAHTVLGMLAALDSDRDANDAHYLRALDHAAAAHDVLQLVRIHANRSSQHLEEGDAAGALVEAEVAVRLADLAGVATFRALALNNRGEALLALGRLDEARVELEAARAVFDRLGSSMASYPNGVLGQVHLLRGDRASARAAFHRALELSEEVGDVQGLVPALTGLASVSLLDDPQSARGHVERALSAGASLDHAHALVVAARVKLAEGDPEGAVTYAQQAALEAADKRDRSDIAEVYEVMAEARSDRNAAQDALALWGELDNPIGAARATLLLARFEPDTKRALKLADKVVREARALGAREIVAAAQNLIGDLEEHEPAWDIAITCLGGFTVTRQGEVVPASAWQSRKARDLLKILVCRSGRPIHREQLLELLWPGEDPARTGNRLSVALSTVRTVLDPRHEHPADHYVRADGDAIGLHNVAVDVARFLADANTGLALAKTGSDREARPYLEAAELAYAGDVLEEDPYADWAVDLREKARLTYLDVARRLAELTQNDDDARTRYLLRILERDPYDESAHLQLVALLARRGRHGEARRRYRLYARQLAEIGVEAAPYPATEPRSAVRSNG
jgi:ATP/maltotriose-dependent transcriptional regulator MalT